MIAIVVAAYQPEEASFVRQLESIHLQTEKNWTCLIGADSPLSELQAMPKLRSYFEDPRFRWIQNAERLGHAANFWSTGLAAVQDDQISFVAWSDQDDIWLPNKLEISLNELLNKPKLSLVHSDLLPFSTEGSSSNAHTLWQQEKRVKTTGQGPTFAQEIMIRCPINGNTTLFDADLLRAFPTLPATVQHHDQWIAILAALSGGVFGIDTPLVSYRVHERNVSGINPFRGITALPKTPGDRTASRSIELALLNQAVKVARLPFSGVTPWTLLRTSARASIQGDPVLFRASVSKLVGAAVRMLLRFG